MFLRREIGHVYFFSVKGLLLNCRNPLPKKFQQKLVEVLFDVFEIVVRHGTVRNQQSQGVAD